ncbi:SseB family protein [Micromonospora sp. CA-263727]|uniref:SseB family protein n=1 Tax=Micromonospora sp. CA-263727 TaxID=3239967 RepID=UPI003D92DDF4
MTDWEPATAAEAAMRDALGNSDQQLYFRILSSVELLLPVSAETAGGLTPVGWGTWTTGGRTHVLAFTSAEAMRACLGEHAGPSRRTGYAELAAGWPNHEWWLAVNPGLPVEGYLPAWYVSQLSRGDVRLPGRTVGARARLERVEALNRSRDAGPAAQPVSPAEAPGQRPVAAGPGRAVPASTPSAFQLPEVPFAAPSTVAEPHREQPTLRTPGHPDTNGLGPVAPDGPQGAGGSRPDAFGGDGQRVFGAARPEGPGGPPPRRPMPARGEESASPGQGWPTAPERSGPPANGRPADSGADQTGRRSFFEPAAGRSAQRGDRLAERATPPSRFARGSQPFPRRGPAGEPPSEGSPRAFVFTEEQSVPPGRPAPAPDGETTQPLATPGSPPEDPTRPVRVTAPPAWTAPAGARPAGVGAAGAGSGGTGVGGVDSVVEAGGVRVDAAEATQALFSSQPEATPARPGSQPAEATQPLPRSQPAEESEELPASIAEPVSGPPAPRRGFTPIVIEGTIIEARDLATGAATDRPGGAGDGAPPLPEERPHRSARETPVGGPAAAPPPVDPPPIRPVPAGVEDAGMRVRPAPAPNGAPAFDLTDPTAGSEPTAVLSGREPETVPRPTVESEPTVPVSTTTPDPAVESELTVSLSTTAPVSAVPVQPVASAAEADAMDPVAGAPGLAAASRQPSGAADEVRGDAPAPGPPPAPANAEAPFRPANAVEEELLRAAGTGNPDTFLSTLLLARVLMPVAADSAPGSRPGDPGFVWPAVELDGQTFVVVYSSPQRLADHADPTAETLLVRFVQLIRRWPDLSWSIAVNPGTPVGAKLPGEQIVGLANSAAELGLGDDSESEPEPSAPTSGSASAPRQAAPAADPARPIVMQKAIAPSQLGYYLERGYDRVSGFVHRASELAHLTTPAELYQALGLNHPESPFAADAEQIYVLRWPAFRPSLYRIPYGGQSEAAMRAMEGWVIERPPFRGNGFAPGESSDVVAEFKVDSVRLPHGAQLLRIGADGSERLVAVLDADSPSWRQVGER